LYIVKIHKLLNAIYTIKADFVSTDDAKHTD
jgi:hypothetical protein